MKLWYVQIVALLCICLIRGISIATMSNAHDIAGGSWRLNTMFGFNKRNKKISQSNKEYYRQHGLTRTVKVNNIDGLTEIHLPRRRGFKTI